MFNLFKKQETNPDGGTPVWWPQAEAVQQRWFVFLDKLETHLNELCDASVDELKALLHSDSYNLNTYSQIKAGVLGQVEHIRKKAYDTNEEKINGFYDEINSSINFNTEEKSYLYRFRDTCHKRYADFTNKLSRCRDEINAVETTKDLEAAYQQILQEYESIKNKFTCTQCGGHLQIEKIFFITTHITCPYCKTQNTFEPGTQARGLEFLARELAEQRATPLLLAYEIKCNETEIIFAELRQLKNDSRFENSISQKQQLTQQIKTLEKSYTECIRASAILYENYLRAMFDEWNSIVPDLTPQNEKFHQRLLDDFKKTVKM